jgi:hypothetical protein
MTVGTKADVPTAASIVVVAPAALKLVDGAASAVSAVVIVVAGKAAICVAYAAIRSS